MSEPRRRIRRRSIAAQGARHGDRYVPTAQDVDHQALKRRLGGVAKTNPEAGARGISAFIIEKGFKGFTARAKARQARHARFEHHRARVSTL